MSSLMPLTALVMLLGAAEPTAADGKGAKPAEIAAYFHDSTVIHGVVVRENIEIMMRFGKLAVPFSEIRRIEFGHRVPDDVAGKIDDAIKRLGHDQFPQREGAGKELIAHGKLAYPALLAASQSADKEVSRRATIAIDKIREAFTEEQLQFRTDDVIYTRDCVLTGRIASPVIKAQTQKFGDLTFKLADLRAVYSMATSTADISVEAAPFAAAPGKWLDAGVEIEVGMGLVVSASGKVDLVPQQPGQYIAGPEGSPQAGQNLGVPMGTLMGRIGEKGEPFVIGKRYEAKTTRSGKLFVFIVPTLNGQAPAGAFKVKAVAGFGLAVNPAKNQPTPTLPVNSYFSGALPSQPPVIGIAPAPPGPVLPR